MTTVITKIPSIHPIFLEATDTNPATWLNLGFIVYLDRQKDHYTMLLHNGVVESIPLIHGQTIENEFQAIQLRNSVTPNELKEIIKHLMNSETHRMAILESCDQWITNHNQD